MYKVHTPDFQEGLVLLHANKMDLKTCNKLLLRRNLHPNLVSMDKSLYIHMIFNDDGQLSFG